MRNATVRPLPERGGRPEYIEEPYPARWLFGSPAAAPIWLVVRLWLGYEWARAGWEKVFGADRAAWLHGGSALRTFASDAIRSSGVVGAGSGVAGAGSGVAGTGGAAGGRPQVAYGWYTDFLRWVQHNAGWVAKVVAVSELVIGLALLAGLLTGIAAFLGLVLNFSYVFAGSAGANPAFILVGLLLVLAWRNAGWYGADRVLLPLFGTPWHHGLAHERRERRRRAAARARARGGGGSGSGSRGGRGGPRDGGPQLVA